MAEQAPEPAWIEVIFSTDRAGAPLVEDACEAAGALAVTLGDAGDEPQLEPPPGATPLWSAVRVTALFADEPLARAEAEALAARLAGVLAAAPVIAPLANRPWERVWLDTFGPTRFGERLWVCPRGQRPEAADAVVVALDPGLAFGTGHHPTTALCLTWLDGAALDGATVIDYGCGSGILAIAALRLGAARARATDHDEQALTATRSNAEENGVADRLAVYTPAELPETAADLLLANILLEPLINLAPRLAGLVRPGGVVVLSGILVEQVDALRAAYDGAFELAPTRIREDWALLSGVRRG